MIVIDLPITSPAAQPNIRSAAGFHETMMPSSVLLTMASSEELTMAARRSAASCCWSASASMDGASDRDRRTGRRFAIAQSVSAPAMRHRPAPEVRQNANRYGRILYRVRTGRSGTAV